MRKHFTPITSKTLNCKTCGKKITVSGDAVEVECGLCLINRCSPESLREEIERVAGKPKPVFVNGVKRGRGRPKKDVTVVVKKNNKPLERVKKMEISPIKVTKEVKHGEKKDRKATIGSTIVNFICSQKGEVKFSDILGVYSKECELRGKRNPDQLIEERNCSSTLYILARNNQIREVSKKSLYSAIE
jgi:predicted RNA-binding Zn-ribbon protein involved in translation (DUF1610 family)